MKLPVQF